MQKTRSTNRQLWLTLYRWFTVVGVTATLVMVATLLGRSFMPINSAQATKVERASSFLQDVGFSNPVYLGVRPATEGSYPTFRATAIGGEPVDLYIRTNPDGSWGIQPVGTYKTVASADDFARTATMAVYDWENIPADIKPRTDGAYGEYETRKTNYNLLLKYDPRKAGYFEGAVPDETSGWPKQ